MKNYQKLIRFIFIFIVTISISITSTNLIIAAMNDYQAQAAIDQYVSNNPNYQIAVIQEEMVPSNMYGIEKRKLNHTISENELRRQNLNDLYDTKILFGGTDMAKDTADEIDSCIMDQHYNKQKAAYLDLQIATTDLSTEYPKEANGSQIDEMKYAFYCDYLSFSLYRAKLDYYTALETECRAKSGIAKAQREEGYIRPIDLESANVELERVLAEKKNLEQQLNSARQKLSVTSQVSMNTIEANQYPANCTYREDDVLAGFQSANHYVEFNQRLQTLYSEYVAQLENIISNMDTEPLSQYTTESEVTEDHIKDEEEFRQYLITEIENYRSNIEILTYKVSQYEIDLRLYVTALCNKLMECKDQYQLLQSEITVLSKQRNIQNALLEEGLSRRYEILQYDTKIKEKEYQREEALYQLLRIIYIMEHYVENQEV